MSTIEHLLMIIQLTLIGGSSFYVMFMVYRMERGFRDIVRSLDQFTDRIEKSARKT